MVILAPMPSARSRILTSPWCPIVAAVAGSKPRPLSVTVNARASSVSETVITARDAPECRAMLPSALVDDPEQVGGRVRARLL
jgi:hypothetical protein